MGFIEKAFFGNLPMELIETIKLALQEAERENRKMATFHSLVLIHADVLRNMDPHEFCQNVEVPDSYCTEFRKMISVKSTLSGLGYSVRHN